MSGDAFVDNLVSMWWIASAAVLAPVLALATRRRIPDVVWLLALGVVLGPHGLALARETESVGFLRELGMGMLFLLAGFEVDAAQMRSHTGLRAALLWLVSTALAVVASITLFGSSLDEGIVFALASTSTALGTLLPILKDLGILQAPVGRAVMVHGAWGELLPIVAMSVLLSARAPQDSALVLLLFALVALGVVVVPARFFQRIPFLTRAFSRASNSTMQTTMRVTVWVLVSLMLVSSVLSLDVALGSFVAGMLLDRGFRLVDEYDVDEVLHKVEIVGFSLLVPVFFVTSGMGIDVAAVIRRWQLLAGFVVGVALFRGLPLLLDEARGATGSGLGTARERGAMALFSAAGLPIIVAVTQLGVGSRLISSDLASVMVTGGTVTVLLFPLVASLLLHRHLAGDAH